MAKEVSEEKEGGFYGDIGQYDNFINYINSLKSNISRCVMKMAATLEHWKFRRTFPKTGVWKANEGFYLTPTKKNKRWKN